MMLGPFLQRHLFLFGHLRSHSSVLSHVLGSHPQIDGACETHTKYRSYLDLYRLHHRVGKLTGGRPRADYVFDAILHDYPMARTILDSERTRAVLLVRRPREAARSIIQMGLDDSPVAWHRDFELVARYYETRLSSLLRLSEILRGRVVFMEAEYLFTNTREVLDQLAVFLELRGPLQPASAEQVAPATRQSRTAVSLPRALTIRLQNAYDFWCAAIRKNCPTINIDVDSSMEQDEISAR